jgi:predicted dehydrogenase
VRAAALKPRLGFLGVGWIGRNRLEAVAASELAEIRVIADASREQAWQAAELVPGAVVAEDMDEVLDQDVDGVVIATPSALHAAQAVAALERGIAVFCQKPLARTAGEAAAVVSAARTADRLLAVDMSYRHADAMRKVRELVRSGEIGEVFAADLVFHNAYGPDKPWFYDLTLAGGGCVMDLGIHLVDLALWVLDWPEVTSVRSGLFAGGKRLPPPATAVEDYAVIELGLDGGRVARLACSWNLHAGADAVIGAAFHGTRGSAEMRNVGGSFYDFSAARHTRTSSAQLSAPPDGWGGRAAVAWARRLASTPRFDAEAERLVEVARVIDEVYGR